MGKIIIHCAEDISHEEAMSKVLTVVSQGKISGYGKSYCYVTKWGDQIVSTREPRKGSKTHTFYVYREQATKPNKEDK